MRRSVALLSMLTLVCVSALAQTTVSFQETALTSGIDFVHNDTRSGQKFYIETAASGGGFLDFDQDGDLDVYLINAAVQPGWTGAAPSSNRLFENRNGRFYDVTEQQGVGDTGYGMGMCVGDPNGDGVLDLFVTNYGKDRLFLGKRGGAFVEVGKSAGVDDARWGASCAFSDVDQDGDHDLYVTHYVDFHHDRNPYCGDRARNLRSYCHPTAFGGTTDSLFINRGDGTFVEEGRQRGIAQGTEEKSFGVVFTDLDNDGDADLYVANDGTENRLYKNLGGRFEEVGLLSGVALSRLGRAQSGMGVAARDVDGDGAIDLFVTNYSMENNALYRNQLASSSFWKFEEVSQETGVAAPSFPYVGWGALFADFDNDADVDLAVVNGHAVDNIEVFEAGLEYAQPNLLLINDGKGLFSDQSSTAGPAFVKPQVSRGLAQGDFNGDGLIDLLVTNTNGRPDLLVNRTKTATGIRWISLHLDMGPGEPLPIGARVTLTTNGKRQIAEVRSGGSFLSQSDLRLHFGLGLGTTEVEATIRWPDGTIQQVSTRQLDRVWRIQRKVD